MAPDTPTTGNASTIQQGVALGVMDRIKSMSFMEFLVTVLLLAIMGGVYWGVPYLADRIEAAATKMEASHREERAKSDAMQAQTIQGLTTSFEKTLDRLDRRAQARDESARGPKAVTPVDPGG